MKNTEIKLSYSFLQQCQCYFKFIVNRFIIKSIFLKREISEMAGWRVSVSALD